MKRFDKIRGPKPFDKILGPKPSATDQIVVLPNPNRVWGGFFILEPSQRELSWLCHQSAILAFIEIGQVVMRSETGSMVLSTGTLIFVPPNYPYLEQRMGTRTSGWYISLPKIICSRLPAILVILKTSDLLLAIGARIASLNPDAPMSSMLKNLIKVLLDEIRRAEIASQLTIPIPHTDSLRRVAEQVMKNPSDMQSINVWAKIAGMSRRSFTRSFLDETGFSFGTWRRRVKFADAIKEFKGGKSVADISFSLGYQNPSTFIAVFKKQFGMSPSKFLSENMRSPAKKKGR